MKDSILIFGGSPFVSTINLQHIDTNRFDILCINRPVHNIPCHYLVAYDEEFRQCHTQKEVQDTLQKGLNPVFIAPKTEFIHKTTGWEFRRSKEFISRTDKILGFWLYTCSSAVNFAYLRGYKNVYLIGVDLEENNEPFNHWHGIQNIKEVPIHCAKMAKEYIYQYKKYMNIYQVNPKVKAIWDLPYVPIEQLYR